MQAAYNYASLEWYLIPHKNLLSSNSTFYLMCYAAEIFANEE